MTDDVKPRDIIRPSHINRITPDDGEIVVGGETGPVRRPISDFDNSAVLAQVDMDLSGKADISTVDTLAAQVAAKADVAIVTAVTPGPGEVIVGGADGPVKIKRVPGNRVAAIGDSITAGAGDANSAGAESYYTWLGLLSGGRVRIMLDGNAGIGGQTSSAIQGRVATDIVPLAPDYCIVMAGTNDILDDTPDYAGIMGNLTAIYDELIAAGTMPVACAIPPKVGAVASVAPLNYRIAHEAARRSIPFVNTHDAIVDPASGGILAAYTNDGTHPNEAGARMLAMAIWDILSQREGFVEPIFATSDVAFGNMLTGGTFATDTNSDGLGDGWALAMESAAVTPSLVVDAGIAGKWQRLSTTGAAYDYMVQGSKPTSGKWSVGDTLLFAGKLRTAKTSEAFRYSVRLHCWGSNRNLSIIQAASGDIDTGAWCGEITIPSGTSDVDVEILLPTGGAGRIDVGQLTLINLTTLGLA